MLFSQVFSIALLLYQLSSVFGGDAWSRVEIYYKRPIMVFEYTGDCANDCSRAVSEYVTAIQGLTGIAGTCFAGNNDVCITRLEVDPKTSGSRTSKRELRTAKVYQPGQKPSSSSKKASSSSFRKKLFCTGRQALQAFGGSKGSSVNSYYTSDCSSSENQPYEQLGGHKNDQSQQGETCICFLRLEISKILVSDLITSPCRSDQIWSGEPFKFGWGLFEPITRLPRFPESQDSSKNTLQAWNVIRSCSNLDENND